MTPRHLAPALIASLLLGACSLAPAYHGPNAASPAPAFKAEPGWAVAAPADDVAKGEWWKLFADPALDALEAKVAVTNQNVAYYRGALEQARGAAGAATAQLFPTVGVSGSANRSGNLVSGSPVARSFSAGASASWVPDLFGRLANNAGQARAQAQASDANLANATLAAQASLATAYFQLRGIDAQRALLDDTVAGYRRSREVARNKYAVGLVSRADLESAETTLANAEAARRDLDRQRATLENAIAVLVGENPSGFRLAPAAWAPALPAVPATLPAAVLQRRPDVAAAERNVAVANAGIGAARAAFFPDVTLSSSLGSTASTTAALFGAANSLWSGGASAALSLLDFGARSARVKQARGSYDSALATYRQTVLTAFQEVENNLAALDAYRAEAADYQTAAAAAGRAEAITRNQYAAGTVDYTTVAAAEGSAYNARAALIQNTVNRQSASVALIQAIGGHW
ncbi:MAG: efflux transporter outer membrane subunit [Proteobacteria bacterium]|nr:efflux transporter outer membrane subunit [Pseudomonadota bacterium]